MNADGTLVRPPVWTRANAGWPAFALSLLNRVNLRFHFCARRRHTRTRLAQGRQAEKRHRQAASSTSDRCAGTARRGLRGVVALVVRAFIECTRSLQRKHAALRA